MRIGIPNEEQAGQRLVAATPDTVKKLRGLGFDVCVEYGAGTSASAYDEAYAAAGATLEHASEVWQSDIVVCLDAPSDYAIYSMAPGSTLITRMNPAAHPALIERLAQRGITGLAIDAVPRISRAQSVDVRSSMANVAGYRAVIEAASAFGRLFAGQVTAAGKIAPARVYVIGVGVAGLAAIGTAKSMGAIVSASDVRAEVADQVESLDAQFVPIPVSQHSDDGYAKEMTAEQERLTRSVYAEQAQANDIIITTAQVPGKKPPLLIDAEAVSAMKPGSVIVDMGASAQGGNCELSRPDEVVRTSNGVCIIGFTDLASRLPGQASQLFGQNIVNLLKLMTPGKDGRLVFDQHDEIIRGITVTLDGAITWPPPPVSVSAAPSAKSGADATKPGQSEQTDTSADERPEQQDAASRKPAWKRWWWKIALGLVALGLIFAAPEELAGHFFVFELACVAGFYVITNVTHALHTPLMSVTNAISGIIVIGALLQIGSSNPVVAALAFVATLFASINIFGGFLVTRRMLSMFKRSSED